MSLMSAKLWRTWIGGVAQTAVPVIAKCHIADYEDFKIKTNTYGGHDKEFSKITKNAED